jgi:DNA-directed RNA polymerase specialized sigma24 family protein
MISSLTTTKKPGASDTNKATTPDDQQRLAAAFNEFYDKYAPAYYGEIKRRLYKDEVSQEVLEKVLKDVYHSFHQLNPSKEKVFIAVLKLVKKEISRQKVRLVLTQILHRQIGDEKQVSL